MKHRIDTGEGSAHGIGVPDIALEQFDIGMQIRRSIGVAVDLRREIVERADAMSASDQIVREMRSDEPRAASDEDVHGILFVLSRVGPLRVESALLSNTRGNDPDSKRSSTNRPHAHLLGRARGHMHACAYGLMRNLSDDQVALVAGRSRALGDATRVRILAMLSRGEQSVGQLAEGLGTQQSTISKHLQVLFHAALVHRRREASTVFYAVASAELVSWMRLLGSRQLQHAARDQPSRIESQRASPRKRAPERERG